MAGQRREHGAVFGYCHGSLAAGNKEEEEKMKERERKVGIYKRRGLDYYNLAIPKMTCVPKMSCVSFKKRAASSHTKLRLAVVQTQ